MLITKHSYKIPNRCQCFKDCDCANKPLQIGYYYNIPYIGKYKKNFGSRQAARHAIISLYKSVL